MPLLAGSGSFFLGRESGSGVLPFARVCLSVSLAGVAEFNDNADMGSPEMVALLLVVLSLPKKVV